MLFCYVIGHYNCESDEEPALWRETSDGGHLHPEELQARQGARPHRHWKDGPRLLGSQQETAG